MKSAFESYPSRTHDTVRYGDTDRQGHVNNATFGVYLETGRASLLHDIANLNSPDQSFVLARTEIDYLQPMNWPGTVEIGSRIISIGRTSMRVEQALFQQGNITAKALSVIVQVDNATGKPLTISEENRAKFLECYG